MTAEEEAFFRAENVSCKEMEAAAIAGLSRDLGIPFLAVKAVTDLIDHPEPEAEAFQRNLRQVSRKLVERSSRDLYTRQASTIRVFDWILAVNWDKSIIANA